MGKKQHQKDKIYLTNTEWSESFGGKKPQLPINSAFRRLPFDHCSLSLQPFTDPYCTEDGNVFDVLSIVPYLKKYGVNPINGQPLSFSDLIKLNVFYNADKQMHCPVTFKVFTNNSHMVAIKTTGNVYAFDAIEQLNLKPKYFKDLLTDVPFTKKDIITLQDPNALQSKNLATFYHVQNKERTEEESGKIKNIKTVNATSSEVFNELNKFDESNKIAETSKILGIEKNEEEKDADFLSAAVFTKGRVAASLTSTTMDVTTKQENAVRDEDSVRYDYVKKKGFARLVTNLGDLNLELFCHLTPRTCDNFIRHCNSGYYRKTIFHRSIKHFMIQGGDPTGTGEGGKSAFENGAPFADEFKPQLSHSSRGFLSMANSGPDTNRSQFFITFRSCKHLDKKHTIFGRVVGGLDVLSKMEQIKTDAKDKPLETITIQNTIVFVNPYIEAQEEVDRLRGEKDLKNETPKDRKGGVLHSDSLIKYKPAGVGQYLNMKLFKRPSADEEDAFSSVETMNKLTSKKAKLKDSSSMLDFSQW